MANFDKVILNGTTYTIPSGGGGTVDTQLSPTSTNAVQNKAIYDAVNVIKEWNVLSSQNLSIYVPQNTITDGKTFRLTIKDVYASARYLYIVLPLMNIDNNGIFYRYDLTDLTSYSKWDNFGTNSFADGFTDESVTYDSTNNVFVFTATYNDISGYSNYMYGSLNVGTSDTEYTSGNVFSDLNMLYNEAEVALKLDTPDATPVKTIVEGLEDNEIFIPQYWNVNNFGSEGDLYIQLNNYNILSGEYGTSTQTQQLLKYDPNSFSYNYDKGLTFDYKKTVEPDIAPEVNITDYDSYSGSDYINISTDQLTVGIDFGTASNGSASFNFGDENNNTYEFMVEKWGDNININVSSYGMYYYYKQYQFPSDTSTAVITLDGAPFAMLTSFNKSFGDFDVISAVRIYNGTQTMSFDDMLADIDSKLTKIDEVDEKEEVAARALNDLNTRVNGKQATLVSGTNIKTINNESILGSGNITIQGGGSSYTAGTNISIDSSGGTDTINCTLPIKAGTNSSAKGIIVGDNECSSTGLYSISLGHNADNSGAFSLCMGSNTSNSGSESIIFGNGIKSTGNPSFVGGINSYSYPFNKNYTFSFGQSLENKCSGETSFGIYNKSRVENDNIFGRAGNTIFTIGNGYDYQSTHNRHNAFEIRQNGDIYIPDTDDTTDTSSTGYSTKPMLRLQDYIATIRSLVTRVTTLEEALAAMDRTVSDLRSTVSAINARTQNVITTTEGQLFGEAVIDAGGFANLDATDSATALAELGYQPT